MEVRESAGRCQNLTTCFKAGLLSSGQPHAMSASAGMGRCAVGDGCQPPQALTAFTPALRTKIDPSLHSETLLPILPSITLDKPFSEHPGTDNYPRL